MEAFQALATPLATLFFLVVGGYLLKDRLDRIESRMDAFPTREEMDARFVAVDIKFDAVGAQFGAIDRRLDAVDARFEQVDRRFDAVDARFDQVDRRLDRLSADGASLRSDLTQIALAVGAKLRPEAG